MAAPSQPHWVWSERGSRPPAGGRSLLGPSWPLFNFGRLRGTMMMISDAWDESRLLDEHFTWILLFDLHNNPFK